MSPSSCLELRRLTGLRAQASFRNLNVERTTMEQTELDRRRALVLDDLAPVEELSIRVLNADDDTLVALVNAPRVDWPRIQKSVERHFGSSIAIQFHSDRTEKDRRTNQL